VAVDRTFDDRNRAELVRLRRVAQSVTDAELTRHIENGWTVSATFGHIAFWDRQRLELLRYWAAGGEVDCVYPGDVFNAALLPLLMAAPPRETVNSAVQAAEALTGYLESLPDEAVAGILARPHPPPLDRSPHWGHHLDQIERAQSRPS
jgi:hypothetical protein